MTGVKITSGLEDYIEAISNNIKKYNKVRPIDLSKELGVSRASVSEALRRLCEQGLINYGRYGAISITSEGELAAQSVISRHELLRKFLCEVLLLDDNEASENACKIEHVISQAFIDRLTVFVDYCLNNREFTSDFKKILH